MPSDTRPVVVITGASAGLGRATARAFARRGWRVGLIARGADGLAGAAKDVWQLGGEPLEITADVADQKAVGAAAGKVVDHWGRIDVWVNNAMATIVGTVDDISPEEFQRVTEVTYLGQVHGTQAALGHMRRQGRGTIVQVGSALAVRSIPLQAPYCAAKAAVRAFTDSLRSELLHEGSPIRVSIVHMPGMNTPQFEWVRLHVDRVPRPVAPVFDPEGAAEAVVKAAYQGPRELWVGGSTVQSILGQMVAPGLLDRLVGRIAWKGQLTNQRPRHRADNLFEPVRGDRGARGPYGRESKSLVRAYNPAAVRGLIFASAAILVAGAAIAGRSK